MKAIKEIRAERDDVYSFFEEKHIIGIDGSVTVEEKIDETTIAALQENKKRLQVELEIVNKKLQLISELWEQN